MKFDNQLNYAIRIIESFDGKMPLSAWLKNFFRQNKQMGSRDRKQLSEMVYCFYRLGHSVKNITIEERILTGLFFCSHTSNEILQYFRPLWNENIGLSIQDKITVCEKGPIIFQLDKIFPWNDCLSDDIDHISFCSSFLQQPDLFIRIRPGYENQVRKKLQDARVPFKSISPSCLAFANATKLDEILDLNKEVVIQDLNSQNTSSLFNKAAFTRNHPGCWDCCAASGGKSIMLHDIHPNIHLTVSDIRRPILINLKKRFEEAGIKKYHSFIADLTQKKPLSITSSYDLILVDAPCSGSGTWARTPEELYFFEASEIERYSLLQKKIISNVLPCLKKTGTLAYITCSVFKKENEDMVDFIQSISGLKVETFQLLKGYDRKADSMFAANFSL